MAWQSRGTKKYYYITRLIDGKVKNSYMGRGAAAYLAAEFAADVRARRLAEREALRAETARYAELDETLRVLGAVCAAAITGVFTVAGYHRQNRSPWRRRKHMPNHRSKRRAQSKTATRAAHKTKSQATGEAPPPNISMSARLRELARCAGTGDAAALAELRSLITEHSEIWRTHGDLAWYSERALLNLLGAENVLVVESVVAHLAQMKAHLLGASPSPLVRLLVDQVTITWLQSHHANIAAAHGGEVSIKVAAFLLKRQTIAHREHHRAILALAFAQRLEHAGVFQAPTGTATSTANQATVLDVSGSVVDEIASRPGSDPLRGLRGAAPVATRNAIALRTRSA
jgi:hypothetical protein